MKSKIALFAIIQICAFAVVSQTTMNIHQSNGTVLQIPLNTIDSITYTIPNPGNLAVISTLAINNITSTTASSGGDISNDGGTLVTQRGVVWSTSPNPTTAGSSTNDGSGVGAFSSTLSGLSGNTTYYIRAYATNSAGTSYGNELSFTTTSGGGIVSNPGAGVIFDGNNYTSVVLGNGQEWMAENLRSTIYANGDPIPNVQDQVQWNSLTTGAWVHSNNDIQFDNPYGKLYNRYAVNDSRNICPTGWHVPTDSDWDLFTNYLGGVAVAGGKMKLAGTLYWLSPNTDATNESGFSGLPGGARTPVGFGGNPGTGSVGLYWTSSIGSNPKDLNYNDSWLSFTYPASDSWGASVRCLKD
jgi:uncharacterized protein (TIGR02145 family)